MGEVIYLTDIVSGQTKSSGVRPKSEARSFHNHRYVLQFVPGADADERWHWLVKFTRTFEYRGMAADIEKADRAAKRKIEELEGRAERTG